MSLSIGMPGCKEEDVHLCGDFYLLFPPSFSLLGFPPPSLPLYPSHPFHWEPRLQLTLAAEGYKASTSEAELLDALCLL